MGTTRIKTKRLVFSNGVGSRHLERVVCLMLIPTGTFETAANRACSQQESGFASPNITNTPPPRRMQDNVNDACSS
ncbi:hypothetical protein CPLU01_08134 [Colletotrichum plurivorum]|uniref:Uncharacterized protein n=1 Tax=Colletotrichum plurivorum TaxID=2175906 RepID=A0A8H6KE74_9PEZI|nr:hypothetical protein CPLU01_08134 [Colletotrichum plurivorum]